MQPNPDKAHRLSDSLLDLQQAQLDSLTFQSPKFGVRKMLDDLHTFHLLPTKKKFFLYAKSKNTKSALLHDIRRDKKKYILTMTSKDALTYEIATNEKTQMNFI